VTARQTLSGKRAGYHHGNLRDDLINASRALVRENGQEHFKVSDACRHAGVSTAAPYRHFSDRQALLAAVAVAGFNELRDQTREAGAQYSIGSIEAVSAIGKAYVAFASREPNLFKLMFGQSTSDQHSGSDQGFTAGRECYEVLLEQLVARLDSAGINEQVIEAAFPLWTFVHGISFLVIDGKLSVNQMPIDINRQIERATTRLMPDKV